MSTSAWVTQFLKSRDLRHPDGRPLCAYRCTTNEFCQAKGLLQTARLGQYSSRGLRIGVQPLFCLYASEWWRRNYEGGPWTWEHLREEAGLADLPLPQLYRVIEGGLKYWKRELLLSGVGRAFLLTLSCEGGLPLRLLQRDGTKLRSYFKALLQEFQLYRSAGYAAERLAENVADRLPRSLRQTVVYAVSGQLIDEIWKLRNIVQYSSTPIQDLDRHAPDWRSRLPLAIEDATAEALLKNLVKEASLLASNVATQIAVVRHLTSVSGSWVIEAELAIPGTLTSSDITALRLAIEARVC